jgi:integrase
VARKRKPATGLKRGEGTIATVYLKDGTPRYKARWYDPRPFGDPQLVTKTFGDRDDAEDHLRRIARDKRDGRYAPSADMTVTQAIAAYLERGRSGWKPATYATYKQRAASQIEPTIGATRLSQLTTALVQHWIDTRVKAGVGLKTLEEARRLLSAAMAEAARLDIIKSNPVTASRAPTAPPAAHVTWTLDEVKRVFAAVADDPMWHALYRLEQFAGLRPGELRTLRWTDVDLDTRTLTVRRTMTRDDDLREIVGTTTKTGRNRAIALPRSVVDALRVWKVVQAKAQLAASTWDPGRYIFTGAHGQPLGGTTWDTYHKALIERTGVTPITMHEIRHTNATIELAAGTHPKIVADRLGHSRIETTLNLYSHVSPDLQRAAIDALEERLEAETGTTT